MEGLLALAQRHGLGANLPPSPWGPPSTHTPQHNSGQKSLEKRPGEEKLCLLIFPFSNTDHDCREVRNTERQDGSF